MTPGGSSFLWGATLFLAGLITGAFGAGVVFETRGEKLDVEGGSTTFEAHTTETEALKAAGVAREASPLQEVGDPMLDADHDLSSDTGDAVVAIGIPMDADAELFIPSSNDNDEAVVQIGGPRDVDAPP